uniref:Uncharacterized protein n=1 Tax=Aegilops tauschii subsp. strangulata TaxID=200361 RepID=A0A453SM45_AEGTS
EAYTTDGSLDFDGNPALKNRTGGWRACRAVLGNLFLVPIEISTVIWFRPHLVRAGTDFCYCLAFHGISYNLVTYLTAVLGQSNVVAARSVSSWKGTCYLTPLAGAVVADSYWGRYRTMVVSCSVGVAVGSFQPLYYTAINNHSVPESESPCHVPVEQFRISF